MHLFNKNTNIEIFNSLQVIRIMSQAGDGIQTIIEKVSKSEGYVANKFKKIIYLNNKGVELEKAISKIHEPNKFLNNVLNTFKISLEQNIDLEEGIKQIEEQIIDEQKNSIDKFILHTNRFSFILTYVTFLSFFYLIIEIINWVFKEFIEEGQALINDSFRMGFFIFGIVIFLLLSLMIKKND